MIALVYTGSSASAGAATARTSARLLRWRCIFSMITPDCSSR